MDYWIWFASIDGVSTINKRKLIEQLKEPEKIYKMKYAELKETKILTEKECKKILNSKNELYIKNIAIYMEKYKIKYIKITDKEYPLLLKNIYDYPIVLFYQGDISLLKKKCIAVVGTRTATKYGKAMSYKIGKEISEKGGVVVSGLASGVDAMAQFGAIPNTIAVVGTGLDIRYPKENEWLYKKIEENGLILSEYVVGTKGNKYTFPARNRIISGISDSTIVVQAGKKSGALITAEFAIESGRNVYAVPGNINILENEGTNNLIKDGALIYTQIDDLNF